MVFEAPEVVRKAATAGAGELGNSLAKESHAGLPVAAGVLKWWHLELPNGREASAFGSDDLI